jgi:uncharacterized protein YecT (DUF1311 family)
MKFFALLLSCISFSAVAQYNGPAVEACRAFAKRELAQAKSGAKEVVIERDRNLVLERHAKKAANRLVGAALSGYGAVVYDGAPSAELAFVCLLADEKRPVFFNWLPRENASALAQCTRSDALRSRPRPCLEHLLQVAEQDLMQAYANSLQEARERDVAKQNESFSDAYRKSNGEWRQYRDAECLRRRDASPKGVSADDHQLACSIDLTRRRALDMR